MKRAVYFSKAMVLVIFSLLFLVHCSAGTRGGASDSQDTVTVSKVGINTCYECHADATNPVGLKTVFGDASQGSGNVGWLNGPHGNNETINLTTHATSDSHPTNTGWPYYGYNDLGSSADCTTSCHDQLDQGQSLYNFYIDTGITALGRINRPIISCESCHGGGGNHFGVGPLEYDKPEPEQCNQCHNETFDHLQYHPEGGNIYDDYSTAPHSNSINPNVTIEDTTTGLATTVRARCSRCHSDEGARRYVKVVAGTSSYTALRSAMTDQSDIADASVVQCRTCHDSHNPLRLLAKNVTNYTTQSTTNGWSDEYITCTSCHQHYTEAVSGSEWRNFTAYHAPVDDTGATVNSHGAWDEVIVDTHYDDPATTDIEGYIVDPASTHSATATNTNTGTCRDCHNPHSADATLNRQWAKSGHGGFISEIKDAAALVDPKTAYSAGVGESNAPAWMHYDWKAANRQACQRCHTSTGFRNFANDQAGYDQTANTFIATGEQRELLYCWGCHTNNKGGLRNPGTVNPNYSNHTFTFPDSSGSNICLSCHSGRGSGEGIKNSTADFTSTSFQNSHYKGAGGTLYRSIGYEFTGKDYDNAPFYEHDAIGVTATGTGSNGPCIGCHMSGTESHTFLPVTKSNGTITALTSTICGVACHQAPYTMTVDVMNTEAEEFADALEALRVELADNGFVFVARYPYFFTDSSADTAVTNWGVEQNMGSAFNYNYLLHDAGAYAHNRYYAKRLIYDSIDWLDDGVVNDSVATSLDAALHSGASYLTGAKAYLLVTRVQNR